eukprot:2184451-Alexandrium_andersonii.AAC.1
MTCPFPLATCRHTNPAQRFRTHRPSTAIAYNCPPPKTVTAYPHIALTRRPLTGGMLKFTASSSLVSFVNNSPAVSTNVAEFDSRAPSRN